MKVRLILLIIVAQVILIVWLFSLILRMNNTISVHPIDMKKVDVKKTDKYKFFYEPKANSIDKTNDWVPYKGTYTINNDTLNELNNYPKEKQEKTFRIITLGDSFTFGLYVDTKNNWPEVLEIKLNKECKRLKYEVINLGVYGYDMAYSVERYKIRGVKYNPDLVVWFVVDPDRIDELFFPVMKEKEEELKATGELDELRKNGKGYEPWDKSKNQIVAELGEKGIYLYQIDSLNRMGKLYNGKLLFIMEEWFKTRPAYQRKIYYDFAKSRINTYIFDEITDTVSNSKLHFPTDKHPNINGHKAIAEDVFNYLQKNNLIPCRK